MSRDQVVEPGRIVFLTGASSSGKTSLARAVQAEMPMPFLHFASDHFALTLPSVRAESGPFAYWTKVRPRFFQGFHRCIPAMASAGNDLIIDHLIEFDSWRTELRDLLEGFDVFLIGVHCDLDELDRRETARGDRRLGEGREHIEFDKIHDLGAYDYEIDTTGRTPAELAQQVMAAWEHRGRSSLFVPSSPAASGLGGPL